MMTVAPHLIDLSPCVRVRGGLLLERQSSIKAYTPYILYAAKVLKAH